MRPELQKQSALKLDWSNYPRRTAPWGDNHKNNKISPCMLNHNLMVHITNL